MKILKLLIAVLITGACAVSTHAQKLRYVPQAIKGAKAVPYVVKPELPTTVRTGFAMPVVRPNVAVAVERQVAKKLIVEERIARLRINLNKLEEYARTHNKPLGNVREQIIDDLAYLKRGRCWGNPEDYRAFCEAFYEDFYHRYAEFIGNRKRIREMDRQIDLVEVLQNRIESAETHLTKLEEYVRTHNNKLPTVNDDIEARNLRLAASNDIRTLRNYYKFMPQVREKISLFRRYEQLFGNDKQQKAQKITKNAVTTDARTTEERVILDEDEAAQERAWHQVLLQDKAWKAQPEEIIDPAENAEKAATLVEQQLTTPQTITDDYINQLLQFYNKLDPMGTGSIQ